MLKVVNYNTTFCDEELKCGIVIEKAIKSKTCYAEKCYLLCLCDAREDFMLFSCIVWP